MNGQGARDFARIGRPVLDCARSINKGFYPKEVMNMLRMMILSCAVVFSGLVQARGLDLSLSNDTVQLRVSSLAGNPTGMGNSEMDLGLLYSSGRGASKDSLLGMLGMIVVGNAGSGAPMVDVGVGLKLFAAKIDNDNLVALGLSGRVHYHPKQLNRLRFTAELHYAPDIVTFIDANRFLYTSIRVEYEVLPQAMAYVGYRNVWADLNNGPNEELDNGAHLGLNIIY